MKYTAYGEELDLNPKIEKPKRRKKPKKYKISKFRLDRLTEKLENFAAEYTANGGNATKAALTAYPNISYAAAKVLGHNNLKKPAVKALISDAFPDKLLNQRHLELLNKREYIVKSNGEVQALETPDTQAVSKALDMAYKIKGKYAAEKHDVRQLVVNISQEMANKYGNANLVEKQQIVEKKEE